MNAPDLALLDGPSPLERGEVRLRGTERLPPLADVDRRLRRGALGAYEVDALAAQLASLHTAVASSANGASRASPHALERRLDRVLQALDPVHRTELDETSRCLRAFLHGHRGLFASRAAAGHPGSLANVTSVADVTNDLTIAGRVDLAERFLGHYLEASDDYQLLQILPFHAALRALERSLETEQGDARGPLVAQALVDRARRVIQPPTHVAALVVVAGAVSDLRRTAAWTVAIALDAPCVRLGALLPRFGADAYAAALHRAQLVLASGRSCVLEGGFRSSEMRVEARQAAEDADAGFRFVECRPHVDGHADDHEQHPFMSLPQDTEDLCPHEYLVIAADAPRERALAVLRGAMRPWVRAGGEP